MPDQNAFGLVPAPCAGHHAVCVSHRGGALVNLAGELVGITTTASTIAGHEQPAGYAIPLNAAMRRAVETMRDGMAPEYERGGRAP